MLAVSEQFRRLAGPLPAGAPGHTRIRRRMVELQVTQPFSPVRLRYGTGAGSLAVVDIRYAASQ